MISPREQLRGISRTLVREARVSVSDSPSRGVNAGKRRQERAKCPGNGDNILRFGGFLERHKLEISTRENLHSSLRRRRRSRDIVDTKTLGSVTNFM